MHNRGYKEFGEGYLTEIFTDATINFLKGHREDPFFVTLSYNSVHHLIHQVPKRYLDKHGVREIPNYNPETMGSYADWFQRYILLGEINAEDMRKYYLANLNCLDDSIGRLLDTLEQQSIADNTIVVLFSDNGGPPTTGACNLPLAGSKFTLWEGGIRVPFVLARPEESTPGTVCEGLISTLDILPTCLQAAGIELPGGLDGQAIPKDATEITEQRDLFWRWGDSYAVRSGDWKLLHTGSTGGRAPCDGIVERTELFQSTCLFNLQDDPGESTDLSQEHPEIARRLQEIYDTWSEDVDS